MCTRRRKASSSRISPARFCTTTNSARLLTFPNVLITATQAFLTQEALGEIARA
jgi:hypothetical protein